MPNLVSVCGALPGYANSRHTQLTSLNTISCRRQTEPPNQGCAEQQGKAHRISPPGPPRPHCPSRPQSPHHCHSLDLGGETSQSAGGSHTSAPPSLPQGVGSPELLGPASGLRCCPRCAGLRSASSSRLSSSIAGHWGQLCGVGRVHEPLPDSKVPQVRRPPHPVAPRTHNGGPTSLPQRSLQNNF